MVCGVSGVVYRELLSTIGKTGVICLDLASITSIRILNSSFINLISSIIYISDIALFAEANLSPSSS